jgi:hypothetical protein
MTIQAKIIADSKSSYSRRLTTFQLLYPRFIHGEFMTHRKLSRNASSSRATPIKTLIANIKADTAIPIHWGAHQKGMQADEECNEEILKYLPMLEENNTDKIGFTRKRLTREEAWIEARNRAIDVAEAYDAAGYHKQIVNRILEPFSHISVIATASSWDNFFHLRADPDAQPEIGVLAETMLKEMIASKPTLLKPNEWHLPYVTAHELNTMSNDQLVKISVARCARVSYLTHDGETPELAKDLELYDRLVGSTPLHASPAEHQAMFDTVDIFDLEPKYGQPSWGGNFGPGFIQYRKLLSGENCLKYEPLHEVAA